MQDIKVPVKMSMIDLMTLPSEKRSVSPLTPSPSKDMRGIRLFRAISRKLTRRSQENLGEDDSRSSSTDSCSSASGSRTSRSRKLGCSSVESGFRSASPQQSSSGSSDAGSDCQMRSRHHHHSTSADSIRKVFQNLSVSARSQSCTNTRECKKKNLKKPKRILRSPVSYTYVKGLSGLPTQRVPRTPPRVYLNSSCSCTMQYKAGLNR